MSVRGRVVATVGLIGLVAVAAVGGGVHTPAQASVRAASAAPAVLRPPPVPHSGTYLGLDPNFAPGISTPVQARVFERRTGRTLGIVSFYSSFGQIPDFAVMRAVESRGSLPMVNMNCGAPDTSIAAGRRDNQLRSDARALKRYGDPVLFRWFWEMNLPNVNGHAACLAGAGGRGYIAAFRHIWTIFRQVGASNVAFVWCPSDAHSAVHQYDLTFYPGSSYVDWVGADLYDRTTVSTSFGQQFHAFYERWTHLAPGKPIMLAETGADGSLSQQKWLEQIDAALTAKVPHLSGTPYSHVHAVVYVDAIDVYNYILHKATRGFDAYADIAHQKHFSRLGGS